MDEKTKEKLRELVMRQRELKKDLVLPLADLRVARTEIEMATAAQTAAQRKVEGILKKLADTERAIETALEL